MTAATGTPHDKIERFMDETLAQHGLTPLGVGWRSRENQWTRFDQFLRLFEGHREPFTVSDLGCGLGGLYEWIKTRGLPLRGYVGYDLSEKMISECRKLHPGPDASFVRAKDPVGTTDFAIGCGIFNTRLDETDEAWTDYMRTVVRQLAATGTVGFAFNSLTSYVDWREPHLFYADPAPWFDFCKREFSKKVALLHDSPLYEWTIVVRH